MIKKILKYGLFAAIAFFTLTGIGALYVYFNQDEIKGMALEKINQSINGTIFISNSEASLLSSFPNVSIDLQDPHLVSVGDTLLVCEELQLKMNLFDFIKKEYRISELAIVNGIVELKTLKNGDLNYEVWKTDTIQNNGEISFEIESIALNNVRINYANEAISDNYNAHIDQLKAGLELDNNIWNISLDGDLLSFDLKEDTTLRISQKEISLSSSLVFEEANDKLKINTLEIKNEDTEIEGSGELSLINDEERITLDLKSISTPNGLLSIFKYYYTLPENFKALGRSNIISHLDYHYGKTNDLKMTNAIVVEGGEFIETNSKEKFKNIQFDGNFNIDNDLSDLIILDMRSEMSHGDFALNGKLIGIPDPDTDLDLQGELNLRELSNFLSMDSVLFDGKIRFNNSIKGKYLASEFGSEAWIDKTSISGEATLNNGEIEWKDQNVRLRDLSGKMFFSKDDIAIQDFSGDIEGTTFNLNGTLSNTLNYFLKKNEILVIEALFEADQVDLEEFIVSNENVSNRSELSLPENIEFKLNSTIQNLVFNQFQAKKLKGLLSYKNKRFDANDVSFNTCNGTVNGRIGITEKDPEKFLVICESSAKELDIRQVFEQFANFDQDFLTSEHLSGSTTSDVFFQGIMDQYLDFEKNTIEAIADIELFDGELIEHPSMKQIAEYLRKKKLLNPFLKIDEFEDNVRHLSFSELKNRIEIKGSKIKIPKMEIKSNAMDANISGTHNFNNNIDYRIDFRMREMLKQHEEEIEEIVVEDDGTGSRIFMMMKGTTADPEISFDKESARAKRKEDLKKAKEGFLEIFKKKEKEGPKEEKIEIKVDDKAVADKKKKGLGKLFKDLESKDEDEAVDFEIIDDE